MIGPGSAISVLDGVIALTGVKGVRSPGARRPVEQVQAPTPGTGPGIGHDRHDSVEISDEARRLADRSARELDDEQKQQLRELQKTDREVRAHEQAHKAAAGAHAGPVSYTYTTGPDGKRYAVAGEVPIDVSPVEGDPEATVTKMQQVRAAALAPAEPSAADRRIAAKAQQIEREAQAEKQQEPRERLDVYA